MAESSLADSSSGPSVILTLVARSAGGRTCAAVGREKSRLPVVAATTSIRSSRFMDRPLAESLNSYSLGKTTKGAWRPRAVPCVHMSFRALPRICFALPNRVRTRERRKAADRRWAGRKRPRSRDKRLITLGRSRTTGHASSRKGIPVGVRFRETIGERLQERDNLVFFLIGQTETTGGHIDIVRHLGPRPAVYFFDRSIRAMSGSDVECIHVAGVVEVDQLLQALDVAVVKELLLEVRPGCLSGGTLWRCHTHIARR